MQNSKLLRLLNTFDRRDWHQFGLYLQSPFFNQTDQLVQFFKILEQLERDDQLFHSRIKKEAIFEMAFPNRPFDLADFNRICSRILALASDYLGFQEWQAAGITSQYYTLRAYHERKLDKHFSFAFAKAEQTLASESYRNIAFYRQQSWLSEIAEWQAARDRVREAGKHLQRSAEHFDLYLLAHKLQHLCNLASFNNLQPAACAVRFADQFIAMAEEFQHIPVIGIYRNLYLMLTREEAAGYFLDIKGLAVQHESLLAQRELNFVYITLINFCIGRIRYGEKDYATPLLSLYEKALSKGFLMDKGVISPWTFKNVVKLGLGLQRFDWVEQFILNYSPLLAEQERAEALHFNLADLNYHRQDFERAQLHLREVDFSDVRYYLHGRVLLAKIYFTTQSWEALDSLLSSFKIYLLRSKKVSREEKKPYLNFIRIMEKLLRRLPDGQAKVRAMILNTPMLTARTWLLEIAGKD